MKKAIVSLVMVFSLFSGTVYADESTVAPDDGVISYQHGVGE